MKNICLKIITAVLFFFITFLMVAEPALAQKINANVKILRDKLQGRNLDLFEGMEQKLQNYLNDYDWAKTDDKTPLKIDIQLSLDKVTDDAGQKRVQATLFISNGREIQYLDNNCVFYMHKGFSYYHNENPTDPFLTIFDFYIYIMLGDELDNVGWMKGTPFFQRAKNIATQAKMMIAVNAKGWEERLARADLFLDPRYQDYRKMKDHYFEALALYEEGNVEEARKQMTIAVTMMESLIQQVFTKIHTERFIQGRYLEMCKVFERTGDKTIFDRLIQLSPKNRETILRYKESQ